MKKTVIIFVASVVVTPVLAQEETLNSGLIRCGQKGRYDGNRRPSVLCQLACKKMFGFGQADLFVRRIIRMGRGNGYFG